MKISNFLTISNRVNIKNQAYVKAHDVLSRAAKPCGFFASGLPGGYEALWARDSMTSALGASLFKEYKTTIKKSLELLTDNQTEFGLIPNCVGSYNTDRKSVVTFNSLDAPLWYIIGHYAYAKNYQDGSLLKKYKNNIYQALFWLKCQDPDNLGLVAQQPTGDWQDAFPHKYGYTINCNALYYAALNLSGEAKAAANVKKILNGEIKQYTALFDKKLGYYLPWAWKNHDGDREQEEWFDSLGNILAIVSGLATEKIASSILNYIEKEKINRPWPLKAVWPPLKPGGKEWHSYFFKCEARQPYHYLNGGVWPFIGGFYIAALVKIKQYKKAEEELSKLAEGVMRKLKIRDMKDGYEFNEWLDGRTGEPKGEPYQAWSAGAYLYAYECVKRKKVLIF